MDLDSHRDAADCHQKVAQKEPEEDVPGILFVDFLFSMISQTATQKVAVFF